MKKSNARPAKRRMNNTAILMFYNARSRRGDNQRLAERTGYSESHISNVRTGRRSINDTIANAMYYISRNRVRQEQYA
jgi:hypothetical protein